MLSLHELSIGLDTSTEPEEQELYSRGHVCTLAPHLVELTCEESSGIVHRELLPTCVTSHILLDRLKGQASGHAIQTYYACVNTGSDCSVMP